MQKNNFNHLHVTITCRWLKFVDFNVQQNNRFLLFCILQEDAARKRAFLHMVYLENEESNVPQVKRSPHAKLQLFLCTGWLKSQGDVLCCGLSLLRNKVTLKWFKGYTCKYPKQVPIKSKVE